MEAVGILMMLLHASRFAQMLGMGMSQARMLLHASRFAEMLGMGISQAGMLLHASRFAEMLDMGMSQAGMLHERGRDSREQQFDNIFVRGKASKATNGSSVSLFSYSFVQ